MPSRLIREGLLDSESVLSLTAEARWLYVSILLSADDVGLFEATPFRLARRADVRREHAEKLLSMLVDTDLVRLYQHGGKSYGFVPRFQQRLQIKKAKFPVPPDALFADDPDMVRKIASIRGADETGVPPGPFGREWFDLRESVFDRDGRACVKCGSTSDLSAHHLTPPSRGGKRSADNLTTLCAKCSAWARNNDARLNEIKHLTPKTPSVQHLSTICPPSIHQPEAEAEAEAEEEIQVASAKRKRSTGPASPTVASLPLASGGEFSVTESMVAEWRKAFPRLDILSELARMRAWLFANPTRRKTARGSGSFVVSWLGRSQDRATQRDGDDPFALCH